VTAIAATGSALGGATAAFEDPPMARMRDASVNVVVVVADFSVSNSPPF